MKNILELIVTLCCIMSFSFSIYAEEVLSSAAAKTMASPTSSSTTMPTVSPSPSPKKYYHKTCEDGYCRLKSSEQQSKDECSAPSQCHYYDCTDNFTCEKVLKPGTDHPDCAGNHFGSCGRTVCEGGACVKKKGKKLKAGETACNEFGNGSECRHYECQNLVCTEVAGPPIPGATPECSGTNDTCYHTECVSGSCTKINGKGSFECLPKDFRTSSNSEDSEQCWHRECSGTLCVSKIGKGNNECSTENAEGKCWHYECTDNLKCEVVLGAGPAGNNRQCNPGRDENVCWHRACSSENSCKKVAGAGAHTCDQDWGENGCKHTDCSTGATNSITDNTCEVIPGKGPIGCPIENVGDSAGVCWHSWCANDTPSGRCAYWSGPGNVACHDSSECPGWLERCRGIMPDWQCPEIPNPVKSCRELFEEACRKALPGLSLNNDNNHIYKESVASLDISKARTRLAEENLQKISDSRKAGKSVTIEVFQDITCGMCNYAFKNIIPEIEKNYIATGKAKIVYRQYPLIPQGKSLAFAKAAHCASQENKHDELVGILYSKAKEAKEEELVTYAKSIGMDEGSFATCLNSEEAINAVNASIKEGEARGIKGTPTFFLNREIIVGAQPFEKFAAKIEEILAK